MRKLTANWLFTMTDGDAPIKNGVVVVDNTGKIIDITNREAHDAASLEVFSGALTPGFINTHCHLELSHMKGKVDTGTGLIAFITNVVQRRGAPPEEIAEAIATAEREMLDGGIVAVGDICNTTDTFAQKATGKMRYYNFVECFDFLQDGSAAAEFAKYKAVYDEVPLPNGSQKTLVPHAPYSVSATLFKLINAANASNTSKTVSLHNQETPPELELFASKTGGFVDFYANFGISLSNFEATQTNPLLYALHNMDAAHRTLLVHNTLTTNFDIAAAQTWGRHKSTFWATCANANLYIENRLPNYDIFIKNNASLTIGTDSLTSNWQLSVLAELQAIAQYQSFVPFETMLKWATINGARALGFDHELGSIAVNKQPGINLLSNYTQQAGDRIAINNQTKVKKIV
ncbi:MAG: hypothetical protein RI894_708 [Bacteroidota bacterium]|jgi:cytosine/adenosine deaminase-related metal-dependent hydrolase